MKDYDKNKESSYLQYWDVNEAFIKKYNEESDEGYFLEVEVQYTEKLHEIHNDLPLLPERKKIEKVENIIVNLHEKTEYVHTYQKFKTGFISWISFVKNFIE